MAVIGLDVGSTGCKSIVFDDDGTQLSYAYLEYNNTGSVYEIDANEIWKCVREVLRKTATESKAHIKALAVSSFGETFVAVDEKGEVLAKSLLYTDSRGSQQCQKYIESMGKERIMRISGANPHNMYSLPKIGWYRENKPKEFARTESFLLIGNYIIFKLCGEKYIDYSLAARTMAFDVTKKKWDNALLQLAGIDEDYMSKAVPSGTIAGTVLPKIADELCLSKDMLVVTGGHDQVCAATGAGITKPGLAIDGIGTVECITPAFDKPILSDEFLNNNYACVPHSIADMYVTYAVNFTGGSILKWYRDNFMKYEMEQAKKNGMNIYELLDKNVPDKPTDIIVVPHFAGSGTPDMDISARGTIFGLRFDTDSSTLYRALLEGVTYEMKYNMERLENAGVYINELKAAGGGAKSKLWLQIKADITGCPIIPLDIDEAGVTGAAMLAAVAAGIYKSIDDAIPNFIHEKAAIKPNENDHKIYLENYERYKIARENSNIY